MKLLSCLYGITDSNAASLKLFHNKISRFTEEQITFINKSNTRALNFIQHEHRQIMREKELFKIKTIK